MVDWCIMKKLKLHPLLNFKSVLFLNENKIYTSQIDSIHISSKPAEELNYALFFAK
jgi:hypothetical protein